MAYDMEVRMKQRCLTEFLHALKIVPNDVQWSLLNVYGDQTVDVSTVRRWVAGFSGGNRDVSGSHAQLSHHEMKSVSISQSARIGGLRLGNCVRSWLSASMRWILCWQRWNIVKILPGGSHERSYRNVKKTVCKFVRNYWTNTRLKVTVFWIASSPVTRRGVITTSRSQNGRPWSGDMWIPHGRKSTRRCHLRVKWRAAVFTDRKRAIILNFLEPGQTINSDRYIATLSWRLEFPVRPEKRMTFL